MFFLGIFSLVLNFKEEFKEKIHALYFDFLGKKLDLKSGNSLVRLNNQGESEVDLSGIILDQSDDEHLETEVVTLTNAPFELEFLVTNLLDQSIIEGVIDLICDSVRKLSYYYTRGISKPTYESKLSSKVKYTEALRVYP